MVVIDQNKILYELPINSKRFLIPKIGSLIFLSVIFYLGVLLNISLLKLDGPTETTVKGISLLILIILIIVGILHNMRSAHHGYRFFANRIKFSRKSLLFVDVTEVLRKENFLDKLFKTHSLHLNKKFKIEAIPNSVDLHDYVQQMVDYNKKAAQNLQ